MKTENGKRPAHPVTQVVEVGGTMKEVTLHHTGLTKREMFAMAAMQGLLSGNMDFHNRAGTPSIAELAARHADQLLKQLENE